MHISTSFVVIAISIASAVAAPLPLNPGDDLELRDFHDEGSLFARADQFNRSYFLSLLLVIHHST